MRAPNADELKQLAAVAKMYPAATTYFREWKDKELEQLPSVTGNTMIAQGRCQVLMELVKLLQNAPDLAAKIK